MASFLKRSIHVNCAICVKGKGTFRCEGCLQIFCSKHSINHRYKLNEILEEIELTRNLIYQTFREQYEQNVLLNKIDQWEQKSIENIHQIAEEERKKIFEDKIEFEQKLQDITNQLREARENEDFIEIDLYQWTQKLKELENILIDSAIIFNKENSRSSIRKTCVEYEDTSDIFKDVCGDIHIKENGYLILKDDWFAYSEILGKNEYNTGQHQIQFKIEQIRKNGWIFFGIISKLQPLGIDSYSYPSSYGWTTIDQIYINGQSQKGHSNDVIKNDIITLIINCDQTKIQMKNERTGRIKELSIHINKCPFPWKLHFNLLNGSTSIRILPIRN